MVKIRLSRLGRKKDPFYRIVAIPSERKRSGKALQILGHWYPQKKQVKIDKKKLEAWLSRGAQVSSRVKKLIE